MIARIRRLALMSLTATVAALLAAAPLGAQQNLSTAGESAAGPQHRGLPGGPTVDRSAVGARPLAQQPASLEEAEAAMQQRLGLGQARALMIVGFSAVIIGLLVGDEAGALIAIGGAVVGLYGLYHYLK